MGRHRFVFATLVISWIAIGNLIPRSLQAAEILLTLDSFVDSGQSVQQQQLGFVFGRALAHEGKLQRIDVVFLIDISGSTKYWAGFDVDQDGARPMFGLAKDKDDNILAAEIAAVRSMIQSFDPRTTRVGLVSFSGGASKSADSATVDAPLTADYARVERALENILSAGPWGATNMRAGLRLAGIEVVAGRSAESTKREFAQRHIVMLTDGTPMVPGEDPADSTRKAVGYAKKLGERDVRIHVYAIGRDANDDDTAPRKIAAVSKGSFTAVRDIAQLDRLLAEVQISNIETLRVRNASTGKASIRQAHGPDGTYYALIPIRDGENTVEVYTRASDGSEKTLTKTAVFGRDPLPPHAERERQRLIHIRSQDELEHGRKLEIDVE